LACCPYHKKLSIPALLVFAGVFSLLNPWNGRAQDKSDLDSLFQVISPTRNDTLNAETFISIGNVYFYDFDYPKAFLYYSRADSVCRQNEALRVSEPRGQALNYMGYSVRLTHDYEKAVQYYRQALEVFQQIGNELGINEVHIGLSQAYTSSKQFDKALPLLNEAIAYHEQNNLTHKNSYSYAIICRGYLLLQMKRFGEAETDYKKYYDLAFSGENKRLQLWAISYMAYFYYETGNFEEAYRYYDQTIKMAEAQGDYQTISTAYDNLIEMYKRTGNLDSLVRTYERYIEVRNVRDSIDKNKEIYALETEFQTEKKEQEIALLTARNQLSEQRRKSQNYYYAGALALLLLGSGTLFLLYRNRLRTARKIRELDAMKSRFFANISHEFRTPLTLIKSPVRQLSRDLAKEENRKQLQLIDQNADRMLELVDQLMELSRLEEGSLRILLKKEAISSLLHTLTEPFKMKAENEGVPFETHFDVPGEPVYLDRDILTKIVVNLLSNAFKYRDAGTPVTFRAHAGLSGPLQLEITNFNKQLNQQDIRNLFERFYRKDHHLPGHGIGLALVRDLVDLYEGQLQARLENEKVLFTVGIPLGRDLKNALVVDEKPSGREYPVTDLPDTGEQESPVLLIADDNADIRAIVGSIFQDDFRILEARDGREAFDLARQEIPDMVITDVMMPKMDGFELVEALRNDELTSLIPVLILTARSSDEDHLAALEHAANAYLTKPFNHEILQSKIGQLLEERRKWRERYSRELVLKPMEISLSSADEKFLARLEEVLADELANTGFSAESFAGKMNLSRMQLHRKLKSLLGVSATEFIRNERLKAAAEILSKSGHSVSEVAYSVGFNDVGYFSKSFKNLFGVPPSEYRGAN